MELHQAVRQSGRSMSRQRAVILEALRATRSHPTAQDLYDAVRPSVPRLTLATVYRNLHVLQDLGLARRIEVDGQSSRFDADTHDHAHVYCLRCGRVHDVPVTPPADLAIQAADATGYNVTHCNVIFEGFCPECQS
jgi:Fur family transcriptional regulator, ferric uptake regulator